MDEKKYKILVVEDNPDWRLTLKGMLNDETGFITHPVATRKEAISALLADTYDAALLDIRLDDSDENNDEGLSLAEEISRRWPKVKIVIATGFANQEYLKRAMEPKMPEGKKLVVDFINKSDLGDLVNILKKALV